MSNNEKYIEEYRHKVAEITDEQADLISHFLSNTKLVKDNYFRGYDEALKDAKYDALFNSKYKSIDN